MSNRLLRQHCRLQWSRENLSTIYLKSKTFNSFKISDCFVSAISRDFLLKLLNIFYVLLAKIQYIFKLKNYILILNL